MQAVIAEELNVKKIEIKENEEDLVHLSAKPNFPKLGPRLGSRMKAAAATIARLGSQDIQNLRSGATMEVDLEDGEAPLTLTNDDIVIQRNEKEGLTVANEQDITIALDTRLDNDLVAEGRARELINRIQNLRKVKELEVADRIKLQIEAPPEIVEAIQRFKDYIASETLATDIDCLYDLRDAEEVDLDGHACRIAFSDVFKPRSL